MEVIIYLVVSVAIVFVPYYAGRLCLKDGFGNVLMDWCWGVMVLCLVGMVILLVITISNVIINAI